MRATSSTLPLTVAGSLMASMACDVPMLNEVPEPAAPPGENTCIDADGDGYGLGGLCLGPDCDETDPEVNPGMPDVQGDGIDNNCDAVDGVDTDGDGRASKASGADDDCNDNDASVFVGAPDAVGDGVDNNCDGIDGVDGDGDAFASVQSGGDDCDDLSEDIRPSAVDTVGDDVDNNCDGVDGVDGDGDTYASATSGGDDCVDSDAAIYPGAPDTVGDFKDNNCDGIDGVDGDADGFASLKSGGDDCDDLLQTTRPTAADTVGDDVDNNCDGVDGVDGDGDTYASEASGGADCDDLTSSTHPGADDSVGDFTDNNCDGTDGVDGDGDGFASTRSGGGDCDDLSETIRPSAVDSVGDDVDNNCDGIDGVDSDGDSYASEASGGTDCVDTEVTTYPGATDSVGDFTDNNCDGIDGVDADGDGYASVTSGGADCDDGSASVNPGMADTRGNGTDTNCDGTDGIDADTDGYASAGSGGNDCDDQASATHPGANDAVGNGVDENCDSLDGVDGDADGYASVASGGDDCDDAVGGTNPGATDLGGDGADTNCDGVDGVDADGDNYASVASGGQDCDDTDAAVRPDASDVSGNGTDENCDGVDGVDADGDTYASTGSGGSDCRDDDSTIFPGIAYLESATECMKDADGDGWGDNTPGINITAGTDCDDNDDATFVGAASIDGPATCMRDADGDGYGDATPGAGVVAGSDCNDEDNTVRVEITGHRDQDLDTYGEAAAVTLCTDGSLPNGYVADNTDCNDLSQATFPGAAPNDGSSACMKDADGDGWGDSNVSGAVTAGSDCDDDNSGAHVLLTGYADGDSDSYGAGSATDFCTAGSLPTGHVANSTDCDDTSNLVFPGAASLDSATLCMKDADGDNYGDQNPGVGIDPGTDCDDATSTLYLSRDGYVDADGDGAGAGTLVAVCTNGTLPGTHVSTAGDCDDANDRAYPGAAFAESATECRLDADGDGYGDPNPGGGISPGSDCDDANGSIFADLTGWADGDGDGHGGGTATVYCTDGVNLPDPSKVTNNDDCNDSESYTFPGAAPLDSNTACMRDQDGDNYGDDNPGGGIDSGSDCDDSDGSVFDTVVGYVDGDDDGFGDPASTATAFCTAGLLPSGYAATNDDCDDTRGYAFPGAAPNDSASACMKDVDGDDYGDETPGALIAAGSDCDDSSALKWAVQDWYTDGDGDGFGAGAVVGICRGSQSTAPTGYSGTNDDCDDSAANAFPGAASNDSATACMLDGDGDDWGHAAPGGSTTAGSDCDDSSALKWAVQQWYADGDGDGFGAGAQVGICRGSESTAPSGHSASNEDCADDDDFTFPGAAPNDSAVACMRDFDADDYGDDSPGAGVVAGTDCDDTTALLFETQQWHVDGDGDSYGAGSLVGVCTDGGADAPNGYSENQDDCADADLDTFPGAAPLDSASLCMRDADGDNWGDDSPGSGVNIGTDCDDSVNTIWPAAPEVDDGIDQDCDGDPIELGLYDGDSDGYTPLYGALGDARNDCDDGTDLTYPGADEIDDGVDRDCNGDRLELDLFDGDHDQYTALYGADGDPIPDCVDSDSTINAAAAESDDGVDEDCDGDRIELGLFDNDQDGFTALYGSVSNATPDCDDEDRFTYPGVTTKEGTAVDCMNDSDGDGYGDAAPGVAGVIPGTDCDDADRYVNVGAAELADDGKDNDCAGDGDLAAASADAGTAWYVDGDAGLDTNTGAKTSPFGTISKALSVATEGDSIFVTATTYNVSSILSGNVSVSLSGGYTSGTWARDLHNPSVIVSSTSRIMDLNAGNVVVQGFDMSSTYSGNSQTYGIDYSGTARITIADCSIISGKTVANGYSWGTYGTSDATIIRNRIRAGYGFYTTSNYYLSCAGVRVGGNSLVAENEISGCELDNAYFYGAGVFITSASGAPSFVEVVNNKIDGGRGYYTGAVAIYGVGALASGRIVANVLTGGTGSQETYGVFVPRQKKNLDIVMVGNTVAAEVPVKVIEGRDPISQVVAVGNLLIGQADSCWELSKYYSDDGYPVSAVANFFHNCTDSVSSINGGSCGPLCAEAHGNLEGDAEVINTAVEDFQVVATSPTVGAGVDPSSWYPSAMAFRDYLDRPRPNGGSWDIGAYEYHSAAVAISGLAIDCSSTGDQCNPGGVDYPVSFSSTGASSFTATLERVSGTAGFTGVIAPDAALTVDDAGELTYTTGTGSADVFRITVTVHGPDGEDVAHIDVTHAP